MATYASLTQDQKNKLADFDKMLRPLIGQCARTVAMAAAFAAARAEIYEPIRSTLGATELIPNTTDLAGSVDLQAFDMGSLSDYLASLASGWTTANRDLAIKAVGAINTVVDTGS